MTTIIQHSPEVEAHCQKIRDILKQRYTTALLGCMDSQEDGSRQWIAIGKNDYESSTRDLINSQPSREAKIIVHPKYCRLQASSLEELERRAQLAILL